MAEPRATPEVIEALTGQPNLELAKRRLKAACAGVSDALEAKLRDAALAASRSKRNANKLVTAISAMGSWFIHVADEKGHDGYREIDAPCFRSFEGVLSDYGYCAIPAPILYVCKNGVVLRRATDW